MDSNNVKSMVAILMQNNGLLSLIDKHKDNNEITLNKILTDFNSMYKVETREHSFYNQYQLICSLYAYVILPKEAFWNQFPPNLKIIELSPKWGISSSVYKNMKLKEFIRILRNSIAHGSIEFNEKLIFSFTDRGKSKISLDSTVIHLFIRALAWWIMTGDITLRDLQ